MKRSMLCSLLVGLFSGSVVALETPRVAAPNPVVIPDQSTQAMTPSPVLNDAPAPASEKVKQAYAAQKANKAQGRKAAGVKHAKKAKMTKHVAKKVAPGRHQAKKASTKRRMRHA